MPETNLTAETESIWTRHLWYSWGGDIVFAVIAGPVIAIEIVVILLGWELL